MQSPSDPTLDRQSEPIAERVGVVVRRARRVERTAGDVILVSGLDVAALSAPLPPIVRMDGTALDVWAALVDPASPAQLAARLAPRFGTAVDAIEPQIVELIEAWRTAGIVEPVA